MWDKIFSKFFFKFDRWTIRPTQKILWCRLDKHWNYWYWHSLIISNSENEILLNIHTRYFQVRTSIYEERFSFYEDTKCVQGHAILMREDFEMTVSGV
jgi:hypothetical protein